MQRGHQFVDDLVVPLSDTIRHAGADVGSQQLFTKAVQCRAHGGYLYQNVGTVGVLLQHLLQAPHLPFNAAQAVQEFFLLLWRAVLGLSLAALNANSAKLFRLWFPGRWTSIAMGIYILGATAGGGAIAMKVGPLMTDPQTGFIIGTACTVGCLVLWALLGRTHPEETKAKDGEPMTAYLGEVLKNKYVWYISFIMFFVFGASIAENSYLTSGLVALTSDPAFAGNIGAVNMVAVGIGGVAMPALLAKAKNLKVIFFVAALLMGISNIVIFQLPIGVITYIIVILQGVFMGLLLPIGKTLPAVIPGVKPEHLGAVGGIQSSMQNLGAGLLPAYIVAPLAGVFGAGSPVALMIGTGCLVIFSGLFMLLLPKGTNAVSAPDAE